MDTQNLKAFVEVAETQSFSAAAEKLHITQPAVSKRIATLEQQLGCKLFDRISRTVYLTEAGAALLPRASQILQAVQDATRSITDLQGDISGELSIGISHHIGLHRLPPVLQSFSKQYPSVHLNIDFMDSEEAYEQIMHNKIELAVITLNPTDSSTLNQEIIWQDELAITIATDHPLTAITNPDLSQLSQYPAILPGLNTYTGQIIKRLFQQHNLKLNISMETNYLETIKMMVSIGLGWSVLPLTMIDPTTRALAIHDLKMERSLGFIYHGNRSLSNAANAFVEALRADAKKA